MTCADRCRRFYDGRPARADAGRCSDGDDGDGAGGTAGAHDVPDDVGPDSGGAKKAVSRNVQRSPDEVAQQPSDREAGSGRSGRRRQRDARRPNEEMSARWLSAIRLEPMEDLPFFILRAIRSSIVAADTPGQRMCRIAGTSRGAKLPLISTW